MAVYFKIRMQYKRTHDGHILEITGSDLAKPLLERGIAVKRGPAPSRVFREQDLIFASTEFPTDEDRCIRLCEASSAGSNFVRGILMIIEGESAHLKNYHTLLADKADSRRRLNAFPRESQLPKQRGSQKPNMFVKNKMKHAFCEEQARYLQCDRQLLSLAAGTPGIEVVSSHSRGVSLTEGRSSDLPDWWASATHFDEDEHFALIFLSSKHATAEPNNIPNSPSPFTDRIVKLFEDNLLSRHPTEDCWEETGSAHFRTTLEYFVEGELPIQFCLPAFPCKSTNPRKTYCADPDGAEYEAFSHLHQFCLKLREIYAPGADFTVVSDGHVFSDCIGVDDREVYKYTDSVKKLSDIIFSELSPDPGTSPIRFVNLRDIFYGSNGVGSLRPFKIFGQKECIVRRPVETIIDPKDETCRRLMLQSCGFDTGMLEKAIKDDEGHSLTKVYRGFSRFMRDDLDHHPKFKNQSASKRGDLANEVAKEMLRRNQAYSHLVELLHPRALRISIHQHKNHGPKFAINTLPNQKFRAIQSLGDIDSGVDGGRDSKVEEAHVPTPWHSVLIEVEGHAMTYIGKNGIALDEKANPNSRYICTIKDNGRGARWVLKERI